MYHSELWGALSYKIKDLNGKSLDLEKDYKVVLHFAEIAWWGNASDVGKRLFNIKINDVMVKENFDVIKEAGNKSLKAVTVSKIVKIN